MGRICYTALCPFSSVLLQIDVDSSLLLGGNNTDLLATMACHKCSTEIKRREKVAVGMGGTRRSKKKKREGRKTEKGAWAKIES